MAGTTYQYVPKALWNDPPPEGMEDLKGVTNQSLRRAMMTGPTEQIAYEIGRRASANTGSQYVQLGDMAYNFAGNAIDIAGQFAGEASKAASISSKLAKATPYVNVGVNLVQGGLTTASGEDPYGSWEDAPGYVAALDVADASPAMAGAWLGPLGSAAAQTLFGGSASRAMMVDQASKNRNVYLNNPNERAMLGRGLPDWNRNMFNQVLTSVLNDKAYERQSDFEARYLSNKEGGMHPAHLASMRSEHGRFLADYDDAQVDQNWMQKAYYAIRSMTESDEEAGKAFEDFLQHTRDNRAEEAVYRAISMPDSSMGKGKKDFDLSLKMGY